MTLSKRSTRILICAGLMVTLGMGVRQTFGLFLPAMSIDLGWNREVFSFAIALQNLMWGASQPLVGSIADRYGARRVLLAGALLYVCGLLLMAYAPSPAGLALSNGVLIGLALSGVTFSVVFGVVSRAVSAEKRGTALGLVGACGSFGQFAFVPFGQTMISTIGWFEALLVLAACAFLMAPLAAGLGEPRAERATGSARQSIADALGEALRQRSFWLLTLGYFTCGFQVVFIAAHLPSYVLDKGLGPTHAMTALALIGLFNIFGSFGWGAAGDRLAKKYLLSALYIGRSLAIVLLLAFPLTPLSLYVFAGVMGLLWLGTVPLTNGIIAQMFGLGHFALLSGVVFFSHQIGSFLGAWLGGLVFDRTGSYDPVWIASALLGVTAALFNLPIDERPLRPAAAQARA
ncbi:MAG TPA: MFS transporter [Burkholderiales bacterium]|nr:MFS transporter [Burkholderiales bacterium]